MERTKLSLSILPKRLAVCRLEATAEIPAWAISGTGFYSITRTEEELSIVCLEGHVPEGIPSEKNWCAIKVMGPLDFSLTGILASLANPLADAGISIFAISTYDTDYLLVKADKLEEALALLVVFCRIVTFVEGNQNVL